MSKEKSNKSESDGDVKKMKRKDYERELAKLEIALVKLQGWIKQKGLNVAVIMVATLGD